MGKYSQWIKPDAEVTTQVSEIEALTRIANEIAESNRLTRLKMEGNSRYDNLSSDQYRRFRKDDLEDKA